MKTNLKHIEDSFVFDGDFENEEKLKEWFIKSNVSSTSKFIDDIWNLEAAEIYNKIKRIDWRKTTSNGFKLQDYPSLLDNTKRVLFLMKTTLVTRKTRKTLSLIQYYYYFLYLIDWMIVNKIYSFDNLNKENFNNYIDWVKNNKCKDKDNYKDTLSAYLYPFYHLYTYREYLTEGIQIDLFEGKGVFKFLDRNKNYIQQTKAIPNDVIEMVCKKIMPIIDYFYENDYQIENIYKQSFIVKEDKIVNSGNDKKDWYVVSILNAIGYFMIGLYTGMRVSELGSLKKNSLEIEENNVVVLNSTLFKLVPTDKGRPEKWGCGINNEQNYALKIIKVLSKLSPDSYEEVFFKYYTKKFSRMPASSFNTILKDLMDFCEVDWNISTHQLRRTFAKLIGITDKTCLLALKEHFKHASLAMTDYYVGTNHELISMIGEERQQEISEGLESILSSDKLAGKLGEKLSQVNLKFRGNVEARKEYINEILNNSDLIVVPHEYGFCIYQPEQAKCKGKNKNIGINTCTKCNNFAVSEKHKVFWINRIEQYENFKQIIKPLSNQELSVQELNFEIEEANKILDKIS